MVIFSDYKINRNVKLNKNIRTNFLLKLIQKKTTEELNTITDN